MNDIDRPLKVVVVGSTCYNYVSLYPDMETVPDRKQLPPYQYQDVGGGGANVAINLKHIARAHGMKMDIALFTEIGQERSEHRKFPLSYRNPFREEVLESLDNDGPRDHQKITIHDIIGERPYPFPVNGITCWKNGRCISKDKKAAELSAKFARHFAYIVKPIDGDMAFLSKMAAALNDADMLILQGSYDPSRIAAQMAVREKRSRSHDRPLLVLSDYDVTNPNAANRARPVLLASDHIRAPGEALAPGMETEDRQTLFHELVNNPAYTAQFYAVSDGTYPVMVNHNYNDFIIPPAHVERTLDSQGAGDACTAEFAALLLQGGDPVESIRRASRVASFSVQYESRDWTRHLAQFYATPEYHDQRPDTHLHLVAA